MPESLQEYNVSGLNPDYTYYFAMKTADEAANWSALSNNAGRPRRCTLSITVSPAGAGSVTDEEIAALAQR